MAPYPYGWTLTWADIVEVDGKYPVPKHPLVPIPEGEDTQE